MFGVHGMSVSGGLRPAPSSDDMFAARPSPLSPLKSTTN